MAITYLMFSFAFCVYVWTIIIVFVYTDWYIQSTDQSICLFTHIPKSLDEPTNDGVCVLPKATSMLVFYFKVYLQEYFAAVLNVADVHYSFFFADFFYLFIFFIIIIINFFL